MTIAEEAQLTDEDPVRDFRAEFRGVEMLSTVIERSIHDDPFSAEVDEEVSARGHLRWCPCSTLPSLTRNSPCPDFLAGNPRSEVQMSCRRGNETPETER